MSTFKLKWLTMILAIYVIIIFKKPYRGGIVRNIWDLPKLPMPEELVNNLFTQGNIRVERIISTGQTSDWLKQQEAEWVVLLAGAAIIEYQDGRILELQAGDWVYLAPQVVHRVAYTSSEPACVWLCFFWLDSNLTQI